MGNIRFTESFIIELMDRLRISINKAFFTL